MHYNRIEIISKNIISFSSKKVKNLQKNENQLFRFMYGKKLQNKFKLSHIKILYLMACSKFIVFIVCKANTKIFLD